MKLKAKLTEVDNQMVEIFDPVRHIVWCVVHRDFFFSMKDFTIEEALDAGAEVTLTVEAML